MEVEGGGSTIVDFQISQLNLMQGNILAMPRIQGYLALGIEIA